jgi:hypothetical protein
MKTSVAKMGSHSRDVNRDVRRCKMKFTERNGLES